MGRTRKMTATKRQPPREKRGGQVGAKSRWPVVFEIAAFRQRAITKSLPVGNEWGILARHGPGQEKEKRPKLLSRWILEWSRKADLNRRPTDYEK